MNAAAAAVRPTMQRISCTIALIAALAVADCARAAEVVVHAGHAPDHVSRALLRGIFNMRVRAWPDGAPVRVFVLSDGDPLHVEFCKDVLLIYPYQLRDNWDRLVYSGTGQPPVPVASVAEMLRRVAENPGAVGYVNDAVKKLPPTVRVLHVQ